jgi:putative ABC transport system ATP-binding protein
MKIIGELKNTGKTILMTSHDPLVFDSSVVDRVVEMRDGVIHAA